MVSRTVKQETLSTMAFFYITGKQVGTKYVQCPPQLLAPLVNMSKTGYKKKYVFAVYPLGLSLKIFTKILTFH